MGKNGVGLAPKIFIKLIHYGTSQNTPSSEMEVKERNMHKKKQIIFAIKFSQGAQSYILKLQGALPLLDTDLPIILYKVYHFYCYSLSCIHWSQHNNFYLHSLFIVHNKFFTAKIFTELRILCKRLHFKKPWHTPGCEPFPLSINVVAYKRCFSAS